MKLGGFGLIEHYLAMKDAGYDYAELDMPEIEALSADDYAKFKELTAQTGLPLLTGARLLPIVTPTFFVDGFKPADLAPYLKRSCHRTSALGIRKIILGNGKARSLPQPDSIKKEPMFLEFLKMAAEIAGENGQELILEPLGPKYSNYINTIPEAVGIIDKLNMPNLFTMADLRHMVWSEENLGDLSSYVSYIHHVHVDYPLSYPERGYPDPADGYDYSSFIKELINSGYQDTLTIEADIPADWTVAHDNAMTVLKELFKNDAAI